MRFASSLSAPASLERGGNPRMHAMHSPCSAARTLASATVALALLTSCAIGSRSVAKEKLNELPAESSSQTEAQGPITDGTSAVNGMVGIRPGARVTDSFIQQLLEVDSSLTSFIGAPEAYDATIVIALAAEAARTDAPRRIAEQLRSVTEGGTACVSYRRCRNWILKNADADYDGISGQLSFVPSGTVREFQFTKLQFNKSGGIEEAGSLAVNSDEDEVTKAPNLDLGTWAQPDGVLTLGTLLPQVEPNSDRARAALAGVTLAVRQINEEFGTLGNKVVLLPDASGDGTPGSTQAAANTLVDLGADAVIGGTDAAVTEVALPVISGIAGRLFISPVDPAPQPAERHHGLFFRCSVPPTIEGLVLGRLALAEGFVRPAVLIANNAESLQLVTPFSTAITEGGGSIAGQAIIDPAASNTQAIADMLAAGPDAVVIIGNSNVATAAVLELLNAEAGARLPILGSAGTMTRDFAQAVGSTR